VLQVGLDGVEADEELVGNLPGFDALLRQTAHALLRRRQGVRIHFSMMLASVCQRQLFTGLPCQAVGAAVLCQLAGAPQERAGRPILT